MTARTFSLPRTAVVVITASVIFLPLGLIFWQSFLNAPFFNPAKHFGFDAYAFIFEDADFWTAFGNSIVIAGGMVVIALPLGAALAFLLTRTDLPAQRAIEVLVLIPVFVSPMVLAFGYVVAMGPVGFYSTWAKALVGDVPWNVYSLTGIAVIAGLTHVPHVYLYSSAALKSLGSDVEEAARVAGANPLQVALHVSLPMTMPALFYAAVLVFFLGFELADVLTLDNFRGVFDSSDQVRAIVNTLLIGTIGGALAVACYTAIGLAGHRQRGGIARILDYIVLIPRAIPGILAGLAFLWIFLFVPGLKELRNSIFSVWLAYTVVWLAYGMRLLSSPVLQIGPQLEEFART